MKSRAPLRQANDLRFSQQESGWSLFKIPDDDRSRHFGFAAALTGSLTRAATGWFKATGLRTWNSAPAASSSYADSLTSSIFQVLTDYVVERRLFLADQGLEPDNGRYFVTQPGIYGIFYNQRCDGCGISFFRLLVAFNGMLC